MQDILQHLPDEKQNSRAWVGLIILLGYFSLYAAFNILASTLVEIDDSVFLNQDPISLLVTQAISQVVMFIVVAILITYLLLKFDFKYFFLKVSGVEVLFPVAIAIGSMFVISAVGEWNMSLDFGDSDFAKWARKSENQLKVITEHLTNFQSTQHFLLAFLAVAIIPAIAEELVFRGLIQSLFTRVLKNHHIAIWLTGLIFATIHFQFFGFAPRMLLGVLFGYLYHWSGNLTTAMIGHLVNNGLALILLLLAQQDFIHITEEQMEQSAPWPVVLIFGIFTAFLLNRFYKLYQPDA